MSVPISVLGPPYPPPVKQHYHTSKPPPSGAPMWQQVAPVAHTLTSHKWDHASLDRGLLRHPTSTQQKQRSSIHRYKCSGVHADGITQTEDPLTHLMRATKAAYAYAQLHAMPCAGLRNLLSSFSLLRREVSRSTRTVSNNDSQRRSRWHSMPDAYQKTQRQRPHKRHGLPPMARACSIYSRAALFIWHVHRLNGQPGQRYSRIVNVNKSCSACMKGHVAITYTLISATNRSYHQRRQHCQAIAIPVQQLRPLRVRS